MVLQHWTQVQVINIPKGMAELAGLGRQQVNSSWRKPSEAQNVQKIPKPPNQYPNWGPYLLSDDDYPNVSKAN